MTESNALINWWNSLNQTQATLVFFTAMLSIILVALFIDLWINHRGGF